MNPLTPGHYFKSRGQRYVIRGTKDHWTRHDRYVEMIRYASPCAHPGCGIVFEALTTKSRIRKGQLNKRCPLHHAPGVPAPVKKVRRASGKKPRPTKRRLVTRAPTISQEARARARLVWKATLAMQRGQRPSYLD